MKLTWFGHSRRRLPRFDPTDGSQAEYRCPFD
jgi:hypothetical protein